MAKKMALMNSSRQDTASGHGMLHRLIAVLMDSADTLELACDCSYLERLALMIHRIMSWQSRQFHTLEHVFSFLGGADALTALAAVFHDLIYFQVDDGLPPELDPLLGPFIIKEKRGICLSSIENDPSYELCLGVFGFKKGQILKPLEGLNEFLSALAMAKSLERELSAQQLAAIAACIEASIPFRGLDRDGRGVGEQLEFRLSSLASLGSITSTVEETREMTVRAVRFGNSDVREFAGSDTGEFLSSTWKLLPESNVALRKGGAYSLHEYRVALEKMLLFFNNLDPGAIYHGYGGEPTRDELSRLEASARKNIECAEFYLRAKILAAVLLESVAETTGGEAPVSLFMGDLPRPGEKGKSLLSYLPAVQMPSWLDASNPVYRLLRDGRLEDSSFDLKDSPLALYLFTRLTAHEWAVHSAAAEQYSMGKLSSRDFLAGFDPIFLNDLFAACVSMVPTRADSLRRLKETLL